VGGGELELSQKLLHAALERSAAAEELERGLVEIDPAAIAGDEARIALWLNLYNALLLRELERRPLSGSLLRHRGIFASASYRVGERDYSLDVIEHGLLRRNARPPYRLRLVMRPGDSRLAASPRHLDPRVHFALNCGATSCPPIRAYRAEGLDTELEAASVSYIRAETVIDRERGRVWLPYLMRLYRSDFGGAGRARDFAAARLDPDDGVWVRERRPRISYGRFDWTVADESR
jgi:hypothetical protein